jgi:SAM-dependent methyltransferase
MDACNLEWFPIPIVTLTSSHSAQISSTPASSSAILDRLSQDTAEAVPSRSAVLDFSQRANLIELMDQPCNYNDLRSCLHDIARVNSLTFAHRPTLCWLDELVEAMPISSEPLRIVDVGCGYGDTLRRIHAWAAKRKIAVTLTGIDLNPDAIRAAKEATASSQRIEWMVGDALSAHPTGETDVVLSTLLTHHLPNPEIVRFLRWMEETAQYGWFINDLHRQRLPYKLFRLWAKFSRWHAFVRHDGPVSIRRSFVSEDWESLCEGATIAAETVTIREYRPARLCVGRIKNFSAARLLSV